MKTLWELMAWVSQKDRFQTIEQYMEFSKNYLEFISSELQGTIVAKNEHNYHFFQYKRDGEYNISRPINADLFLNMGPYENISDYFLDILSNIRDISDNIEQKRTLNNFIYTTQQTIGCALDALPSSKTNTSRKINGDLFERLIRLLITHTGFNVESGILSIPIPDSEEKMNYQNDLEIKIEGNIVAIGSIKTSSKDRIDKVFLDKLTYNKLTRKNTPHFAIFLHDVQRAGKEPNYKVGQTFLTGHFKAYTIGLTPLDGVYYCDLRPVMKKDNLLKTQIKSLDCFLCQDIWKYTKM